MFAGLVAGCGDPISNQLLYEDELFLAALPSIDRLAPPADVRIARVGTSALLASAVAQAATLETLAYVVGVTGEALRGQPPDERSDAVRAWDPVSTAIRLDEDSPSVVFWVRGEVAEPAGRGDLDWTIEVAPAREGPWVVAGRGAHEGLSGSFTWEIADHAALLAPGEETPDHFAIAYTDPEPGRPRSLMVDDEDLEFGGTWDVAGEQLLTWIGPVALTPGSAGAPGAAQILHDPELGGRGTGVVVTVDGELPFDACWDANGNDVWVSGGGAPTAGDASRCEIPAF